MMIIIIVRVMVVVIVVAAAGAAVVVVVVVSIATPVLRLAWLATEVPTPRALKSDRGGRVLGNLFGRVLGNLLRS